MYHMIVIPRINNGTLSCFKYIKMSEWNKMLNVIKTMKSGTSICNFLPSETETKLYKKIFVK